MRKTLLIVSIIVFICSNIAWADSSIGNEKVQSIIKKIGIDINKAGITNLEPRSFTSFNDYVEAEQSYFSDSDTWSTINDNVAGKTDIHMNSSSTLKSYSLKSIIDKKNDTAWVEGTKDSGIGEWIHFQISVTIKSQVYPISLVDFAMIPGYSKSDKTWDENNRVKSALLIFNTEEYTKKGLKKDYLVFRLNFADSNELQVFGVTDIDPATLLKIWVIIEDIYKGSKYNDTCISEITMRGKLSGDFCESQ